jgi:hypothetical protein
MTATAKSTPLEVARAAWGQPLPDWVETLALACCKSSQAKVAVRLEISGAVISQVLRKIYPADTARIEIRVRGVFMDGHVACPGWGELPVHECQKWRDIADKFAPGNPLRNRMRRACNACPRYLTEVTA